MSPSNRSASTQTSRPATRTLQRSCKRPADTRSPRAVRPKTIISAASSPPPGAISAAAPSQRSKSGGVRATTERGGRSDRKVTTDIRLHHVPGEARQYHLAAVHDHIGVGERAREFEALLDQPDRHVAAGGEITAHALD